MGDGDHRSVGAVIGGEQAAINELAQLDAYRLGQAIEPDAAPGGVAGVVDGDQAKQPCQHIGAASAGPCLRCSQGRIRLGGQGPGHPAELLVAFLGQLAAIADAPGKLLQHERE